MGLLSFLLFFVLIFMIISLSLFIIFIYPKHPKNPKNSNENKKLNDYVEDDIQIEKNQEGLIEFVNSSGKKKVVRTDVILNVSSEEFKKTRAGKIIVFTF